MAMFSSILYTAYCNIRDIQLALQQLCPKRPMHCCCENDVRFSYFIALCIVNYLKFPQTKWNIRCLLNFDQWSVSQPRSLCGIRVLRKTFENGGIGSSIQSLIKNNKVAVFDEFCKKLYHKIDIQINYKESAACKSS